MFFCNDREIFHSDGLTRRPPVTLPPAKRKLISAPDKDKCQRADTVQATTCTCLHASALYANQCLTMCIHSASTCLHQVLTKSQHSADTVQTILHTTYTIFPIDNQHTYSKKRRVQTVLQKTVSVDFSPVSTHLHTHTFASTTRTTRITRYGVSPSAHPHIYEHNARTH